MPIEAFLDSVKRGSKKFRIILQRKISTGSDPSTLPTVQTFINLSNTPLPALETLNPHPHGRFVAPHYSRPKVTFEGLSPAHFTPSPILYNHYN